MIGQYIRGSATTGKFVAPGVYDIVKGPPKWDFILCLAEGGKTWPNGTVEFTIYPPGGGLNKRTICVIIKGADRLGTDKSKDDWEFRGLLSFFATGLMFAEVSGTYSTITKKGTINISETT